MCSGDGQNKKRIEDEVSLLWILTVEGLINTERGNTIMNCRCKCVFVFVSIYVCSDSGKDQGAVTPSTLIFGFQICFPTK